MKIKFDPSDLKSMRKLMDECGNCYAPFMGVNDDNEGTTTSVYSDKIIVVTFQKNGWTRKNIYYYDGSSDELFEGKWDK